MHGAHGVGHAASGNALVAIASFARLKRDLGVQNNPHMNMALAKLLFDPTASLAPAPMNGANTLRQAMATMPVNLFLETWSNRNLENGASHAERGSTPGWLVTSRADLLLFYFLDTDDLVTVQLMRLKRWAFASGPQDGIYA